MYKVKKYIIAISVMFATVFVALIVVSTLTYLFKWQADKAMIGIIVTYVLAGLAGGFCMRKERKVGIGRKAIEVVILSTIFISLLVLCSCIGFQISFQFSSGFLLIWSLVTCSVFVSRI